LGWRGNCSDSGRLRGLNNLGQIAFVASFVEEGEGVFVTDAVAIPEPAGLSLVMY
jgi:hypothetical protein